MNIVSLFYQRKWLSTYNHSMENKILNKLSKLSDELNELSLKKQELIKKLRQIDIDMEVLSKTAFELKDLLEDEETLNTDQSQGE